MAGSRVSITDQEISSVGLKDLLARKQYAFIGETQGLSDRFIQHLFLLFLLIILVIVDQQAQSKPHVLFGYY